MNAESIEKMLLWGEQCIAKTFHLFSSNLQSRQKCHSFICLSKKYLLSICFVWGTVLESGVTQFFILWSLKTSGGLGIDKNGMHL